MPALHTESFRGLKLAGTIYYLQVDMNVSCNRHSAAQPLSAGVAFAFFRSITDRGKSNRLGSGSRSSCFL